MRSAFTAPQSHLRPSGTMAGRAAIHPQKEALMSLLLQPNCKPEAQWIDIPKTRLGPKIRRRIQCPSDHHIGNAPTPSMWNLREDPAEGPPATKWMHVYHSNLLPSCPDLPLSTYTWWITVIQKFDAN